MYQNTQVFAVIEKVTSLTKKLLNVTNPLYFYTAPSSSPSLYV